VCSRFYSAMQTQGDLDLYKHRKDLIQSCTSRFFPLLTSRDYSLPLRSTICQWKSSRLHRIFHTAQSPVAFAFKRGRYPQYDQSHFELGTRALLFGSENPEADTGLQATRFLKLLHTELLMSVYPDMTKKEVLEAFNEGKVPRLPDTHIAALYDRWTHSDPRTPFGERYIGLTRVARKYGQLLGFSKNVNNLDALKADVDAASLARRAPNRSRYQPQARF